MKIKTIIILSFVLNLIAQNIYSQDKIFQNFYTRRNIYINSPISLLNKFRIKYEVRYSQQNSYLFSFTTYHYLFRGFNIGFEYKRYSYKSDRFEKTLYLKSAYGITKDLDYYNKIKIKGEYYYLGAGFGQQIYLGKRRKYFIEITEGARFAQTIFGENDLGNPFTGSFYVFGPGAILDLNMNIGWRLGI